MAGATDCAREGLSAAATDRERVLALLKRHGWNATSFQILEAGYRYWFDGDAAIAYADTGAAWVVAGAPVAAEAALADVAQRFERAASAAKRRVSYFAVEQRFMQLRARHGLRGAALQIGEQAVWNAATWTQSITGSRSLKEQLRRARAKGVSVRGLAPNEIDSDTPLRQELVALIDTWLASRPMPPMGFLVELQPFSFPTERRYFVAEHAGRVVAFLAAVPVFERDGWLFEDLVRAKSAPNGTTELLIDLAMRDVAASGHCYVTLGLAPLSGSLSPWLRFARRWTSWLYDFQGLRAFKHKLRPARWEPIYLAIPTGTWTPLAVLDVLTAFARGSLTRFLLRTVARAPALLRERRRHDEKATPSAR